MDPALPAEEHRPDHDHLPKAVISFSIPTFSGDITHHQDNCTPFPDRVQEDLRHWLTRRRRDGTLVILDREEQTQDEEPAEDRRATDRYDDANWSRPGRIVDLFGHMRARTEP
jgi:hypothetical protein